MLLQKQDFNQLQAIRATLKQGEASKKRNYKLYYVAGYKKAPKIKYKLKDLVEPRTGDQKRMFNSCSTFLKMVEKAIKKVPSSCSLVSIGQFTPVIRNQATGETYRILI